FVFSPDVSTFYGSHRSRPPHSTIVGRRPRVGSERSHRNSSSASITVALPSLRAVNSCLRIASKIRVRVRPVISAATSGVTASLVGGAIEVSASIFHLLRLCGAQQDLSQQSKFVGR